MHADVWHRVPPRFGGFLLPIICCDHRRNPPRTRLIMAAVSPAVRFLASKSSPQHAGYLQLRLRVKPGASKARQGILEVTDEAIELCVAAPPRDGAANKAVIQVLSAAMGIPRSRFAFASGMKGGDKIVTVADVRGDGPDCAQAFLALLHKASHSTNPR